MGSWFRGNANHGREGMAAGVGESVSAETGSGAHAVVMIRKQSAENAILKGFLQ